MYKKILLSLCLSTSILSANTSDFEEFEEFDILKEENQEPKYLNKYNEWMTDINHNVYSYTLIPLIETYDLLPESLRMVIDNLLNNLTKPYSILNNILQDNPEAANKELKIFLLNSTIGILGLVDVADNEFGLKDSISTLKETADKYEIPQGYYVVLPFLGPTTMRNFLLDQVQMSYVAPMYGFDRDTNKTFVILNDFNRSKEAIKNLKMLDKNSNKHEIMRRVYLNK